MFKWRIKLLHSGSDVHLQVISITDNRKFDKILALNQNLHLYFPFLHFASLLLHFPTFEHEEEFDVCSELRQSGTETSFFKGTLTSHQG